MQREKGNQKKCTENVRKSGEKNALDPRRQILEQAVVQDRRRVRASSQAAAGARRPVLGIRSHGRRRAAAVRVGSRHDADRDLGDGRGRRQRRRPERVRLPPEPRRGTPFGPAGAGREREQDARLPLPGAGLPELDRRLLGGARRHVFRDLLVGQGDHAGAHLPEPQLVGSRDILGAVRAEGEERVGRVEGLGDLARQGRDPRARGGRGGQPGRDGGRASRGGDGVAGPGREEDEQGPRGCGDGGGDQRGLCEAAAAAAFAWLREKERAGRGKWRRKSTRKSKCARWDLAFQNSRVPTKFSPFKSF